MMKKLLIILLLLNFAFAEFQLQKFEIITKLNENGSTNVEERINIIMFGQYSRQLYESGYNDNTFSGWQKITNISEIKAHMSTKSTDLKNILIRPQPPRKSSSEEIWFSQIIISYVAFPYYDKERKMINNTGIVKMEKYKPRTTRFTLNETIFNLPRTETGDIQLDKKTTLSIILPDNAIITHLNPITESLCDAKFPLQSKTLNWSGELTLVQFSLTYEVEQSLDKEVVEFFSDFQKDISTNRLGQEEIIALIIAAILAFSYFYLRISRR